MQKIQIILQAFYIKLFFRQRYFIMKKEQGQRGQGRYRGLTLLGGKYLFHS